MEGVKYRALWFVGTEQIGHQSITFSGQRTGRTYDEALRKAQRSVQCSIKSVDREIAKITIRVAKVRPELTATTARNENGDDKQDHYDEATLGV